MRDQASGKFQLHSCQAGFQVRKGQQCRIDCLAEELGKLQPLLTLTFVLPQTSNDTQGAERCIKCLDNQYIINPNTDSCEKCPPGLACHGDEVVDFLVPNSSWVPENGLYKLAS